MSKQQFLNFANIYHLGLAARAQISFSSSLSDPCSPQEPPWSCAPPPPPAAAPQWSGVWGAGRTASTASGLTTGPSPSLRRWTPGRLKSTVSFSQISDLYTFLKSSLLFCCTIILSFTPLVHSYSSPSFFCCDPLSWHILSSSYHIYSQGSLNSPSYLSVLQITFTCC